MDYKPVYGENKDFYKDAKGLINSVPKEFLPLNPAI